MKPAEDPALLFVTLPMSPAFALADTDPGLAARNRATNLDDPAFEAATTEPAASISLAALRGDARAGEHR